jgi:phosphoglycerate dehydrogenase-like enzyme
MGYFETQPERTDLPLVVVPAIFGAMYEPMTTACEALRDVARVRVYDDFPRDSVLAARRMSDAEVAIIFGIHFDGQLLSEVSTSVKCLVFGGTGVASYVDLALAHTLGVQVRNIVHYGDASVAEHTIALMFDVARGIGRMDASMKAGEWNILEGMDLHGKTLGLVGFGGIAQSVAAMASAIGMQVRVWARPAHRAAIESAGYGFEASLLSVFSSSNVLSVHVGLNESTEGLIADEHFEAMPAGSIFINTARSQLVAPGALERALSVGAIRAGVDVYDQEPLPADSPLRGFSNVVLTPHSAWFSDTAVANIVKQSCEDVAAYFKGEPLNLVNA